MIKALTRRCLGGADPTAPEVRQRCGTLAGGVGILLNTLLCLGKLGAGLLTGSIAVVADGLNNLSDAASSVITLIGFRLAGQAADEEHPFGHGRIEYLSGLLVAMAILLMGFELGKSSLEKLLHPEQLSFSWLAIAILAVSIGMKIWMFHFNRVLGEAISSQAMKATAADSLSDAVATAVVLAAALVDHFLDLQVDGLAGLLVAAFILKTGWEAAKDTLDPLLGRAMDPELAADIDKLVLSHPNILGIHDLVYHDYGPGRAMMSFHAEVPADTDLLEMHDIIDHIERELKAKHHIETVIHTDPVVNDERTNALREQVAQLTEDNNRLQAEQFELNRLRQLYKLDQEYMQYNKIGARVIARDSEKWFQVFRINKGSSDGVAVDMNVVADGGLVGIVTDVGANYATVRSIIDDSSRVGAMSLDSSYNCIVAGDLTLYEQGRLKLTDFSRDAVLRNGDQIITSNISTKYLPGILIGYAVDVSIDPDHLTQSGYLIPAADFDNLQEVLILTDLKNSDEAVE